MIILTEQNVRLILKIHAVYETLYLIGDYVKTEGVPKGLINTSLHFLSFYRNL
jgi:hypothetical protein